MAQPKSRLPLFLGLTVAGAGGYYLYSAGGNPKVAEKKIEHDAAAAAARLRGQNYSGKEAQKQGEEWAQVAGSKIDHTVKDARNALHDADATITAKAREANGKVHEVAHDSKLKLEQASKDTRNELHEKVDSFDKTVERKTAEAKNGISSWFGFGGK